MYGIPLFCFSVLVLLCAWLALCIIVATTIKKRDEDSWHGVLILGIYGKKNSYELPERILPYCGKLFWSGILILLLIVIFCIIILGRLLGHWLITPFFRGKRIDLKKHYCCKFQRDFFGTSYEEKKYWKAIIEIDAEFPVNERITFLRMAPVWWVVTAYAIYFVIQNPGVAPKMATLFLAQNVSLLIGEISIMLLFVVAYINADKLRQYSSKVKDWYEEKINRYIPDEEESGEEVD